MHKFKKGDMALFSRDPRTLTRDEFYAARSLFRVLRATYGGVFDKFPKRRGFDNDLPEQYAFHVAIRAFDGLIGPSKDFFYSVNEDTRQFMHPARSRVGMRNNYLGDSRKFVMFEDNKRKNSLNIKG